ncbi:MAG: efflux RND transporter periplasmic adaptor subunit [Aliivibrio sp.]|uniref:efflux RND transporter periplasmic adaptor subunit n=1 Tax=Aliivibrio sp. TaxID=1872443 RepID=UPI001A5061F2|nr:efflux RND transporter periplasmic adaptor subunit [Aliivibrio sp.]
MVTSRHTIFSFFSHRPWILSAVLFGVLTFWLTLGKPKAEDAPVEKASEQTLPFAKVVVTTFKAELTERTISLYGRTAPDREATLGAQIAAQVEKILVKKGSNVDKGTPLVQLDKADLVLQLIQTKAILSVKEKEYKAAKSLRSKGLSGEVALSKAHAGLAEAKARVKYSQLMLKNTTVVAPFSGVVELLYVEVGDFVSKGDPIANIVDLDPLVIQADISEKHISMLKLKQSASISFMNKSVVEGKLRYISRVSSPTTNTFPIEVEIPNPKQMMAAGISAEVDLNLEQILAVKVTPAMLALDADGNLGVKTVVKLGKDNSDRVKFVPIKLVKAEDDGVWLSGLGEQVDIITVGQGFVRDGDGVNAIRNSNNAE